MSMLHVYHIIEAVQAMKGSSCGNIDIVNELALLHSLYNMKVTQKGHYS